MYGQGLEPHAQTVQEGGQSGRAGDGYPPGLLQFARQPGLSEGLRVQALSGQEHDGEVGGGGRLDVFFRYVPRRVFKGSIQRFQRLLNGVLVGALRGVQQALIVFLRELGIDGQPHGPGVGVVPRQANGVLDKFIGRGPHLDILVILLRRKDLLQDGA